MAKLIFRYGAMGASKTANALMVKFNYEERGQKCLLLKPCCECRDGHGIIRSRIGLKAKVDDTVEGFVNKVLKGTGKFGHVDAIIVDEVQFLEPKYVDELAKIVDSCGIPVICYGLKTDFMGNLFDASKRLVELADNLEEIPTICWCGCKARFTARIKDGEVVRGGMQMEQGGNESYVALCRKHFMSGRLGAQDI